MSNLHLGTDGLYYEDYVAPEEPRTFTGKTCKQAMVAPRQPLCPDMQFPDRERTKDCPVRLSEGDRFLRAEIRGGQLQDSGDRHLGGECEGPDDPDRTLHMESAPKGLTGRKSRKEQKGKEETNE